jgi:hypothetical protein
MPEPEPARATCVYLVMGVSGKENNLLFAVYCTYNDLEALASDPNYRRGRGG